MKIGGEHTVPHVLHKPDVPAEGGRPWASGSLETLLLLLPFWGPLLLAGRSRAGQDLPRLTLGVCMAVFWVGFGRQDCHQAGALGMGETPSPQCPVTLLSSGSGAAGGRDIPHGCPVLDAGRRTLVTCRRSAPLHSHQGPP